MDSRFPKEVAAKLKEELRATFLRVADYAVQNDVRVVLLAGDVFDSDVPFKKDKDFFYGVVKTHATVDFLYLKGNHDGGGYTGENLPNLKTFDGGWTSYRYDGVTISGTEISGDNSSSLYSTLSLKSDDINIVTLHGQISDTAGYGKINLRKLRNKNIDYLALGHVHKPQEGRVDERGEYVYCGCLQGRGFDETGARGFCLLNIENGKISKSFVPFAEREIIEKDVDITGADDAYGAFVAVKGAISFDKRNIYRINLVGETRLEAENFERDMEKYLSSLCLYVSVKDKTKKKFDVSAYEKDLSLKGEFVRTVYADDGLSEEEKRRIVRIGLKALRGEEIDL